MGLIFNHSTIERNDDGQSFTKSENIPSNKSLTYTFNSPLVGKFSISTITVSGSTQGSYSTTFTNSGNPNLQDVVFNNLKIGEKTVKEVIDSTISGSGSELEYTIKLTIERKSRSTLSIETSTDYTWTKGGGGLTTSLTGTITFSDTKSEHVVNGDCRFSGRIFVEEL